MARSHTGESNVEIEVATLDSLERVSVHQLEAAKVRSGALSICDRPCRLGVTGMIERAAVLGGQLSIGPSLRGGVRVLATLPLRAPERTPPA